jgi:hypothetical protein
MEGHMADFSNSAPAPEIIPAITLEFERIVSAIESRGYKPKAGLHRSVYLGSIDVKDPLSPTDAELTAWCEIANDPVRCPAMIDFLLSTGRSFGTITTLPVGGHHA